jgi:hypothetical protein
LARTESAGRPRPAIAGNRDLPVLGDWRVIVGRLLACSKASSRQTCSPRIARCTSGWSMG